jgi:hypothetical protein
LGGGGIIEYPVDCFVKNNAGAGSRPGPVPLVGGARDVGRASQEDAGGRSVRGHGRTGAGGDWMNMMSLVFPYSIQFLFVVMVFQAPFPSSAIGVDDDFPSNGQVFIYSK